MTSRREWEIGLAVARAMAATPMLQGPDGEILDSLEDLPDPETDEPEEPEEPSE